MKADGGLDRQTLLHSQGCFHILITPASSPLMLLCAISVITALRFCSLKLLLVLCGDYKCQRLFFFFFYESAIRNGSPGLPEWRTTQQGFTEETMFNKGNRESSG